ncbi:unnamed protein product [Caenorhabditis angaria]|uniref:BHLH domain-containing protein n=1 Tax=Caenorhabditis angaria TaxID=860376 RepID=A0A9P1J430_9PELO|nr:unnamed protein product [Caenorhabditis angaria]
MVARRKSDKVQKIKQTEDDNVAQRACANRRERQRTKELNDAFSTLRRMIPSMPSDKMSKIHTLRIATDYISFLDEMKQNGCKLFGRSIFDEKTGYGLQTSFNVWRSSNGLTSVNIPPITTIPNIPTIAQIPQIGNPCMSLVTQPYYLGFPTTSVTPTTKDYTDTQSTPIQW